jgi:glycosyltransferase involved in cell wall biosynthesis
MADKAGELNVERRPLRVAQVNDIAAVAGTLTRAMNELGAEVTLIEPRRPGARLRYPWKAAVLPFRAAGILGAGLTVRRGHFDVVHVHFARLGMIGPLGGRPYTLHLHGTDIRGVQPDSLWGREVRPFIRRARLVYYATPDLREWIEPFRRDAVFLPNPIETGTFRPDAAESRGASAPGRRDLLVGVRLSGIKGLPAILESLRILAATRPATTITIVDQGEGVAAAVAAAGPNAVLVPRSSREELPAVLRRHKLAMGQLLVGALGNYELECLACGVPVVTRFDYEGTYSSPPPIVSSSGAEEAASRIAGLLDDEAALAELAGRGPGWVEANHSARTVAARVLVDYERTGQGPAPEEG